MKDCSVIMAIVQENRRESATKVQDVLTKYGCSIRMRLGLHESGIDYCSDSGLILLQLCGKELPLDEMEKDLHAIPGVVTKHMTIEMK